METIEQIAAWRERLTAARHAARTGVVPTMGALHEGHLTLIRRARAENDLVLVTLFVNPTQFNDPADFERYPRDPERDSLLAAAAGADCLLIPPPSEMYPPGFDTGVVVRGLSDRLEGASRPGHFAGVATVVTKLLGIAQADRAYFGEKDWQQLQVIKRLVTDLNIPTEIIGVPTVREADGLAMSSRNVRLTPEQRAAAVILSKALSDTGALAGAGVRNARDLSKFLHNSIAAEPLAEIDYALVVHPGTLEEIDLIDQGALAVVAAKFESVRLIDNRLIVAPKD